MLKHNYIKDEIRWHVPKHRITLNVTTDCIVLSWLLKYHDWLSMWLWNWWPTFGNIFKKTIIILLIYSVVILEILSILSKKLFVFLHVNSSYSLGSDNYTQVFLPIRMSNRMYVYEMRQLLRIPFCVMTPAC